MGPQILWFATRHEKEKVIAPIARERLGWVVQSFPELDTDAFGTFSGEVERPAGQLETARLKIEAARALRPDADVWLSSEGAFFPDPGFPWLTRNTELILFRDFTRPLEISASYSEAGFPLWESHIHQIEDLDHFLHNRNFHQEGLILKAGKESPVKVKKDFDSPQEVREAWVELRSLNKEIWLQPDLRAHRNAARRLNIEKAFERFLVLLNRLCPRCGRPGFSEDRFVPGLPCEICGLPTRLHRASVLICKGCGHTESNVVEGWADPAFCDACNP